MQKAVIIGAGPAGLTAAYYLLKENTGIEPVVFESEAFVGGIARTAEFHGNRMDIGGHRFFSKNEEIMSLWQELLPLQGAPAYDDRLLNRMTELAVNGPDPEQEDDVFLVRHRVSRIFYLKKFFDYPVSLSAATIRNLGVSRMVKICVGYAVSMLHKLPENTLADFMINSFGRPLYETFFKDYTYKVWGRFPESIGADWGSQRIKGLSLRKAVVDFVRKTVGSKKAANTETSLIEQFYYPKYGPGQLWEKMRRQIVKGGGHVCLETEVIKILRDADNRVTGVVVRDSSGERTIPCDYLISSMPVKDLLAALGEKDDEAATIARDLPYRDFITVGVLVKKLKIKNTTSFKTLADIVPDCWIYVQEPSVKMGRIQIFNNWSPYLVREPEKTVWLGLEYFCNEGDDMWNMKDADFTDMAVKELVSMGIVEKDDIMDEICLKVKKAYPAYFGSYRDFAKVRRYLDGIGNLYCIGRNGQHRYNNMDHSMLTAIEAVRSIAGGTGDKEAVWNVNTEESYHEQNNK